MSLEEIKSFLLQLKAEKKTDTKEEITVQRTYEDNQRTSENKCFRCNNLVTGPWIVRLKILADGFATIVKL